LALAAVGLIVFGWLALRRGIASGHGLAMIVLGGQAAITVVGMGVDWARYHLPILLLVAVCIGVAVGQGWLLVARKVQLTSEHNHPTTHDVADSGGVSSGANWSSTTRPRGGGST
jgi:membrane-bound ClpP family serine protease